MADLSLDIISTIEQIFSGANLPSEFSEYLATIKSAVSLADDEAKARILTRFIELDCPQDNEVSLYFFLYDLFGDKRVSDKLNSVAEGLNSPMDFSEVFWNVMRRDFLNRGGGLCGDGLRNAFYRISGHLNRVINSNIGHVDPGVRCFSGIKNIAIISPQILGMRHSPTREAYNISLHLQRNHGCNVFIINTNGVNYTNNYGIFDPFIANSMPSESTHQVLNIDYLDFKDGRIDIVHMSEVGVSTRKVSDFVMLINELGIDAVISHGENLFFQEALYRKIPSIFVTTGRVVPFAHSDAYWVPEILMGDDSRELAVQYGHGDFMLESMIVSPEGKADFPANRSAFLIPDDAFVYLVVSTRMDREVDEGFISMCLNILDSNKNAYIAFAGEGIEGRYSKSFIALLNQDRVLDLGFQSDLPSICLMSDAYLNLYRQGGGTSAQTAIMNGLPVVTMNYGHISSVVPSNRLFETWDSYLRYALRLGSDQDFIRSEKELFEGHFHENLQINEQVLKIFDKLNEVGRERYAGSNC